MKGYCSICGNLIDETEQLRGVCKQHYRLDGVDTWINKHDGVITRRRVRNARQ